MVFDTAVGPTLPARSATALAFSLMVTVAEVDCVCDVVASRDGRRRCATRNSEVGAGQAGYLLTEGKCVGQRVGVSWARQSSGETADSWRRSVKSSGRNQAVGWAGVACKVGC